MQKPSYLSNYGGFNSLLKSGYRTFKGKNQTLLKNADIIKYFVKNDQGKFIIIKEYRSIVMRLVKKLFCDNLEKKH